MLSLVTTALALLGFSGLAFPGIGPVPGFSSETVSFDAFKPGIMPPYWTATATHGGQGSELASRWEIRRDLRAPSRQNVLAQVSTAGGDSDYPLAVYDRTLCRDGEVSVKFKIIGGRQVKTAGIVFRYQDPNNYYLLNFSADEKRIGLFRVQDGAARPIPAAGAKDGETGVKHEIRVNEWYVAKITYQGSHLRVSFGNRRLFEAVDDGIRGQGKAGLRTNGGTLAEFDDFRISKKG